MQTEKEGKDTMFLLRAAFWLSIVVLFIPGNPATDSPPPRVTMMEYLFAGRAVVADLSNFCERNPDVCVTGGAAWDVFSDKAQNGARLLYRYMSEDNAAPDQGTLKGEDLLPDWQTPQKPDHAA